MFYSSCSLLEGDLYCGWWVLWWFCVFYLPVSLSFTSSQDFLLFLWLHSETANWWADAQWFSGTVSERLYSLRLWWCVWLCVWMTATVLAVWQADLLLRNFCGGVKTLMSKSQKSYGPKRSRPVGQRQTSMVRFVSGRKLLLNLASSKQKLYPPSFFSWRVAGSLCSHFSDVSDGFGVTCFSCDLLKLVTYNEGSLFFLLILSKKNIYWMFDASFKRNNAKIHANTFSSNFLCPIPSGTHPKLVNQNP